MAVYKIFPTSDATLYSLYPTMNTGLDAILEVSNQLTPSNVPSVARYLIQFDQNEILDIINNKINNNQYDIYLKNFIAEAQGINQKTSLEIFPLAQSWNNGTGYNLSSPLITDGVSWLYPTDPDSNPWSLYGYYSGSEGFIYYTSSYNSEYGGEGGGNWFFDTFGTIYFTGSYGPSDPYYVANSSPFSSSVSTSFELRNLKDIEINVNSIIDKWKNDVIPNYGLLIKLTGSQEFNTSKYVQPQFKYYSVDTNTIYPPFLEFRWSDFQTILTGSATSSIVDTSNLKLSLDENPGVFYPTSVNKFKINVSPLYPPRVYQTSSLFTNLNYLPTSSCYAIKDLATNEFVINFDDQYTQISSDSTGNYFSVYMSGLEPERYYKVLIKTIINGSTLIFDDNYYFKVING
jgi:hypothetical protein